MKNQNKILDLLLSEDNSIKQVGIILFNSLSMSEKIDFNYFILNNHKRFLNPKHNYQDLEKFDYFKFEIPSKTKIYSVVLSCVGNFASIDVTCKQNNVNFIIVIGTNCWANRPKSKSNYRRLYGNLYDKVYHILNSFIHSKTAIKKKEKLIKIFQTINKQP